MEGGKTYIPLGIHVFWVHTLSLFGAMASSSSIKIIAGAFFSASSKAVGRDRKRNFLKPRKWAMWHPYKFKISQKQLPSSN